MIRITSKLDNSSVTIDRSLWVSDMKEVKDQVYVERVNQTGLAALVECLGFMSGSDLKSPPMPLSAEIKTPQDLAFGDSRGLQVISYVIESKLVGQLANAAYELEITGLKHVLCAYLALMIRDVPTERVREVLTKGLSESE